MTPSQSLQSLRFPWVPEPNLQLPIWQPPWTSKALPRSLCGQWPRSSATLHLASRAVTGADLCWCPCSARGGGGKRKNPPPSAVQVAKVLIDCVTPAPSSFDPEAEVLPEVLLDSKATFSYMCFGLGFPPLIGSHLLFIICEFSQSWKLSGCASYFFNTSF